MYKYTGRLSVSEEHVENITQFLLVPARNEDRVAQCVVSMDWTVGIQSLEGTEEFSPNLWVQTSTSAHPASYLVGTGGSFCGGKVCDADHSSPSSAEVNSRSCTSSPLKCLHGTFLLY